MRSVQDVTSIRSLCHANQASLFKQHQTTVAFVVAAADRVLTTLSTRRHGTLRRKHGRIRGIYIYTTIAKDGLNN